MFTEECPGASRGSCSPISVNENMISSQKKPDPAITQVSRLPHRTCMK